MRFDTNDSTTLGSVRMALTDVVQRAAVRRVLEEGGVDVVEAGDAAAVVSDSPSDGPVDVLVAEPTLVALADAVTAFMTGQARAVVRADAPEDVLFALVLLARGQAVIPVEAQVALDALPALTGRERRIWHAVVAGQSNGVIARAMGLSVVTVKREVAALCRKAGVASRVELWSRGVALGIEPVRVRP